MGVALALTLAAPLALAFQSSRFVYSRAPGAEQCPDEDAMRKEVAARLGYDPFFVWAERTIVARIERESQGLRATIQLLDGKGLVRGSRTLASARSDCGELAKSMALVISIGIDPELAAAEHRETAANDRALESPPPEPSPPPPPPMLLKRTADRTEVGPSRVAPRAQFVPEFGAGAWSAMGLSPNVAVGGAAFVGLSRGYAALYIEGRASLKAGNEVEVALFAGSIVPCLRLNPFFACVSGSWGELRAVAQRSASSRYVALGGRVGFELPILERLTLRSHFDAAAPLDRTIVQISGKTAWQLPAVSGALGVDLALQFP